MVQQHTACEIAPCRSRTGHHPETRRALGPRVTKTARYRTNLNKRTDSTTRTAVRAPSQEGLWKTICARKVSHSHSEICQTRDTVYPLDPPVLPPSLRPRPFGTMTKQPVVDRQAGTGQNLTIKGSRKQGVPLTPCAAGSHHRAKVTVSKGKMFLPHRSGRVGGQTARRCRHNSWATTDGTDGSSP